MSYAQVTLAISDNCPGGMEGFAPLSDALPVSVFTRATEDGQSMSQSGDEYTVYLDLVDGSETQIGEKCISLAQAALIVGRSAEGLVSLGRQRLAQINDSTAEFIAARSAQRSMCTEPTDRAQEEHQTSPSKAAQP